MLNPLTIVILVLCVVLGLMAAAHLLRRRLIDDRLLAIAAVLELALVIQLVVGLVKLSGLVGDVESITFVAYLFTIILVPPFVIFMAIKEKSQWAMGVVIVGAFVVGVLAGRLEQIWSAVHA